MADYIYTLETRLSPDQLKAVTLVQDAAKAAEMNLYLTGGAIRDVITGFPIRDLDFTVQGNALKLQKDLERAGAVVGDSDDETKTLLLTLKGGVRAEIAMARSERYDKPGKPPQIAAATISEDLRRRDFTVNAMALSMNEGSRGLLMDPFNGAADIEAKVIRVLHNYAFLEDPSRLIRASRFTTRFHWPLEERTQARYISAKENNYIEYIRSSTIGYEIEQLAYEDDPLSILKVYEKEGWLEVLNPRWSTAKVDTASLSALMKTRQQMNELGYTPDVAPAVLYFLTDRMGEKDISDLRRAIPRKDLVEAWKDLEDNAHQLAKRLAGKEAATPSRAWQLLSGGASGDDSVPRHHRASAGGRAEDQELLYQVAPGAAEGSAPRNDRAAHHAPTAGISQDFERRIPAVARRQAALAHRNAEVPEAAGAAAPAAPAAAVGQTRTRSESCCGRRRCCCACGQRENQREGKRSARGPARRHREAGNQGKARRRKTRSGTQARASREASQARKAAGKEARGQAQG